MANFKGHLTGGIITSSILAGSYLYFYNIKTAIIGFVTSLIFSLYPDMDIKSKSQKYLVIFFILFGGYIFIYEYDSIRMLLIMWLIITPLLFKHRGYNHSLLNMLWLMFIWWGLIHSYFPINQDMYISNIAVAVGFSTHLLLDKHWKLL